MDIRYSSVNKYQNKERNSSKINRLNISGQSIILGKNFNILKYLNEIEKEKTEKEINERNKIKSLSLLNPQTPNRKITRLFYIDTNNISTIKNENSYKRDKNNDCFITSMRDEQNSSPRKLSLKFSYSNKQKKLNDSKRLIHSDIRLSSVIQEIRNKNRNLYNNSKTENNKNIINTNLNNKIAFDRNNMEPIIDINNILNEYQDNKEWDMKTRENNYNEFVNKNKEIKVQNILKIIMNNEKEKIDIKFKENEKKLENIKKNIDVDEKNFNQLVKQQKYYNRIIEDFLYKLKDQKRILMYLKEGINQHIRKVEYEVMKKIYEIDELRVYVQFVNYIYGYDTTNYEKPLIEKDSKKIDLDVLVNNVLENYGHLLDDESNEKIKNIDPDIIFNEIQLIQDRILLALKVKDKEYDDLKIFKDNNDSILEGIRNKRDQLEKEYNYLKGECNYIINSNSNQNQEKELFIIGQDLFNFVIEHFSENIYSYNYYKDTSNNNIEFNPFEIGGLAEKSYNLTLQKEILVNDYLQNLKKYEEEDDKIFGELINSRKNQLILEKLKAAKERIIKSEAIERMKIEQKSEKVYFIKRKMHQSIPKKKEIKIKIDPKVIRQQEEKELMTFQ
jgi:hypothetical protein